MKLFNYSIEKEIKQRREIVKLLEGGYEVYRVKFITDYSVIVKNKDKELFRKTVSLSALSNISFEKQILAEKYAAVAAKADKSKEDSYKIIVYPIGYEIFEKYGDFTLDSHYTYSDYSYNDFCWFRVNDKYATKYGQDVMFRLKDFLDGEQLKSISKTIKPGKDDPKVISAFELTPIEIPSIDELEETSKDIQQLNKTIKEFGELQEKQQKFLEKILA